MSDLYVKVRSLLQGNRKLVASKNYDVVTASIMNVMCNHYGHQYGDRTENKIECLNCGAVQESEPLETPKDTITTITDTHVPSKSSKKKDKENIDVDTPEIGKNDDQNQNTQ